MNEELEPAVDAALAALEIESKVLPPHRPGRMKSLFNSPALLLHECRQQPGGMDAFAAKYARIVSTDTAGLIVRLGTTQDPLIFTALHYQLTKRGVPPCLRWPAIEDYGQMTFITWLNDVAWFQARHPHHEAKFAGWKNVLNHRPFSRKWYEAATRQFEWLLTRRSLGYFSANGLGLSDAQRQDLMTMPTTAMLAARRELKPEVFMSINECLLSHAMAHPDRSGEHKPERIASRRAALYRTYLLSGKSPTATTRNWTLLSGEQISRQAVTKIIGQVSDVLDKRRHSRER